MDTPGFEDTDGPELDYANCVMITEAIGVAKNVIPVIFISYYTLSEENSESFRKIIKLVSKLITNIEVNINKLSFFFTQCPYEDENINKKLIGDHLILFN